MRPWDVLLVCILFSSIVGYGLAQAETGRDFLDYKEEQVQRIAEQASANDDKKCELVQSCSDPTECTRGGCSPLKSDSLKCTTIMENKRCLKDDTCNNVLVNFERSYVRYPRYDYDESDDSDSVSTEMRDSICSQRRLDPLFRELLDEQQKRNENSSEDYYFNFYFGSVDGTFRFYPGLEVADCYQFDPRIRPWYLGAISVKKDMIVLLDTGASMANDKVGLTISTTSGQVANILTQHLLKTLTGNDTAKVITFDSIQTSRLLDITVPSIGFNTSDLENLLLRVNGTRDRPPSGPSNYTAALMEAISTLSVSSSDNLKIIILLTDGKSTVPSEDQLAAVVTEIEAQSIKLFIYEISDLAPSLSKIACSSTQGYHERLDHLRVLQNPLYWVNSYFTMLARSNIQAGGPTLQPFWQRIYTDYGNLGSIITVAFPVMSPDGRRLIGVAGIDIQISGLPAILKSQIEESLRSRRNNITVNKQGVAFDNCTAVSGVDGCSSSSDQRPICDKDDLKSSYEDLLCCGECSIDEDPNSQSVVIIAVVCVGAALGVVVGGVLVYLRICKPRTILPPIVDIVKVPKFSYEELYLATNRFRDSNKLGEGTFGVVYRGDLENGMKVAVKKLHFKPADDLKNFESEIKVLATANHNNLLALKGFCVDQYYMLVYELLVNGDLDDWLFEKPLTVPSKVLSWAQRVVIAKGTAKGLAYLHEELQNDQKVCHSDIKPANILLDKDFNPKVADFGMAKLYDRGTDLYADGGTLGYMAPEILNGSLADTKADVYSYGMVLLEMVTGRRFSEFKTQSLRYWANKEVAEGRERNIVDPLLQSLAEEDHTAARSLLTIALCCTMVDPDARPDMSAVVNMIEGFCSVPLPYIEEQPQKLSLTTDHSGESFLLEGSWTLSQLVSRIQGKAKGNGG